MLQGPLAGGGVPVAHLTHFAPWISPCRLRLPCEFLVISPEGPPLGRIVPHILSSAEYPSVLLVFHHGESKQIASRFPRTVGLGAKCASSRSRAMPLGIHC